jgi:hypothetical protein
MDDAVGDYARAGVVTTVRRDMEPATIREKIIEAIGVLFKKDPELLKVNANERSISHKLAEYLSDQFAGYDVDCEYNRDEIDHTKALEFLFDNTRKKEFENVSKEEVISRLLMDVEARTIFPDIIIHDRCTNTNIAVIEMKKIAEVSKYAQIAASDEFTKDHAKLAALVSSQALSPDGPVFRYKVGLFLVLKAGGGIRDTSKLEAWGIWFEADKQHGSLELLKGAAYTPRK